MGIYDRLKNPFDSDQSNFKENRELASCSEFEVQHARRFFKKTIHKFCTFQWAMLSATKTTHTHLQMKPKLGISFHTRTTHTLEWDTILDVYGREAASDSSRKNTMCLPLFLTVLVYCCTLRNETLMSTYIHKLESARF